MKNNKRKFAVIALVVMMMITAVGYAAWSDSLAASGTVKSATFDVKFVMGAKSGEIATAIGPTDDIASFVVEKVLPGEKRKAILYVKNEGNVTAYLKKCDVTHTDIELFHQFKVNDTAALEIGPGETKTIEMEFELMPFYQDRIDGQPVVLQDKFCAEITYAQSN